jgi:hypothetical protein
MTHGAYVRLFNGTGFGTKYTVPEPSTGGDSYWTVQEVGSLVHVFYENRRNGYDMYEATLHNGRWSKLAIYNTAITAGTIAPVLGPTSAGLVYETNATPLLAQPSLNPQSVVIKLAHSTVYIGTKTTLSGTVSPRLNRQKVTLERLAAGRWYNVSSTKESSAGKFTFKVAAVTEAYRAVVAYEPGYYLYGYSNKVTLKAIPKPKKKG